MHCITGYDKTLDADERILMTYVPSHLYHILFELLKVYLLYIVICGVFFITRITVAIHFYAMHSMFTYGTFFYQTTLCFAVCCAHMILLFFCDICDLHYRDAVNGKLLIFVLVIYIIMML